MEVVLELIVPGSGTVASVLSSIMSLCGEMNESQEACTRLHGRLKNIFEKLEKMEETNQLPSRDSLDKYVATVGRSLEYLERYRGKKLLSRLIHYQEMMGELRLINEEIDALFQLLNLDSVGAMMDWKQQWEADQRTQQNVMKSIVENDARVLDELQSVSAQQEAMMTIQYQINERAEKHRKETLKLLEAMMGTVARASKATVPKLPPWFLPEEEVTYKKEPFARGSFGTVHRGVWGHGTNVVVKCFMAEDVMNDEPSKQQIENEMTLWHGFNHPNVIKMFGASHVSSPPFIVCEVATNGDLCNFLARPGNKRHMWRLLYGAALGLEYIHTKRGDLKLNNILVAGGHAKLSDFGLSGVRTSSSASKTMGNMTSVAGGLRWRAPECLLKAPAFASDVYSLAMCMIEAVTGKVPFGLIDDEVVRENLRSGNIPDKPDEMPSEAWELVVSMTNTDPEKRARLPQVLQTLKVIVGNTQMQGVGSDCTTCVSAICDDAGSCYNCEQHTAVISIDERGSSHLDGLQLAANSNRKTTPNPIAAILENITKGSEDEIKENLLLLVQKCIDDEHRALLYSANGVEVLTSLVQSGKYDIQIYALQCLKWPMLLDSKLTSDEFKTFQQGIAEAPRSEPNSIVKKLEARSGPEKQSAAVRCACITTKGKNDKLLKAGVTKPLVAMLQNGDEAEQLWAVEAVGNLAREDECFRAEIVKNSGVAPLVNLATNGTAAQKCRAIYALGKISMNQEANELIIRMDVVSLLLACARSGGPAQSTAISACKKIVRGYRNDVGKMSTDLLDVLVLYGTDGQITDALKSVAALNQHGNNDQEIANERVVVVLTTLLRTGKDEHKFYAAKALVGLSRYAEMDIHGAIDREGGVEPLIDLLLDFETRFPAEIGASHQKKNMMYGLLRCFAVGANFRKELSRVGGIVSLLPLIHAHNKEVNLYVANELRNAAYNDEIRVTTTNEFQNWALEILSSNGARDRELTESAALIIGSLTSDSAFLTNEGSYYTVDKCCKRLIELSASGTNAEKAAAVYALGNLGSVDAFQEIVRQLYAGTEDVKRFAVNAVARRVCDYYFCEGIVRAQGAALLVSLLRCESDEVKERTAIAFAIMANSNDTTRRALVLNKTRHSTGLIFALVELLQDGSQLQQDCAADALKLLANSTDEVRAVFVNDNAVEPLDRLVQNGNPKKISRRIPTAARLCCGCAQTPRQQYR